VEPVASDVERLDDVGEVEENPFRGRHGVEHGAEQVPAPTSDVGTASKRPKS